MKKLWTDTMVGKMNLPHRLAMAPITRSRANQDGTSGELAELYYSQRASLGLIITEGTQPSDDGQGYLSTPGIYTKEHIKGWKVVTDAVHDAGGYLYIQLMHAGRMAIPTIPLTIVSTSCTFCYCSRCANVYTKGVERCTCTS